MSSGIAYVSGWVDNLTSLAPAPLLIRQHFRWSSIGLLSASAGTHHISAVCADLGSCHVEKAEGEYNPQTPSLRPDKDSVAFVMPGEKQW